MEQRDERSLESLITVSSSFAMIVSGTYSTVGGNPAIRSQHRIEAGNGQWCAGVASVVVPSDGYLSLLVQCPPNYGDVVLDLNIDGDPHNRSRWF